MKSRTGKKLDLNQLAKSIVDEATSKEIGAVSAENGKQRAGRAGGLKGGVSRMSALTDEEREALARKAAATRWAKEKAAPAPSAGAGEATSAKQH